MIVSCPACSAKYRIDQSKIKGRGAKITCPRCGHKFIVYKDGPQPTPPMTPAAPPRNTSDIATRDFRKVGVTWRVRKTIGVTYSFHSLDTLQQYLDQDQVDRRDSLSYDARTWVPLDSIEHLSTYFEDIWRKAERGELNAGQHSLASNGEDETEAPTTIMGHGHALMDDIRRAVAEATTPPPSPSRSSTPSRSPSPRGPSPRRSAPNDRDHDEMSEDPTTFSRRSPVAGSSLTPSSSDIRVNRPASPKPPVPGRTASPVPEPPQAADNDKSIMGMDGDQLSLLVTVVLALAAIIAVTVMAFMYAGIIPGLATDAPPPRAPRTIQPTMAPPTAPPISPPRAPAPVVPVAEPEPEDTDEPPPPPASPAVMVPDPGEPASPGSL